MANGTDIPSLTWFKSSKSSANGQCTMCARLPDGGMAVKDSQHPATTQAKAVFRQRRRPLPSLATLRSARP